MVAVINVDLRCFMTVFGFLEAPFPICREFLVSRYLRRFRIGRCAIVAGLPAEDRHVALIPLAGAEC